MFCPDCRKEIADNAPACVHCGLLFSSELGETVNITPEAKGNAVSATNDMSMSVAVKKPFNKKIMVIMLAFIAVLTCTGIIYVNSDSYKVKQAVSLIENEEYSHALDYIRDVHTLEAIAVRNYVDVLKARDVFMDNFEMGVIVVREDNEVARKQDDFKTALQDFAAKQSIPYLPEELSEQYYYYAEKMENISTLYDDIRPQLYNVQQVFRNEVICNRNSEFTLSELQSNINTSQQAYDDIKGHLYDESATDTWNNCGGYTTKFGVLLTDLFDAVKNEIADSQGMIDRNIEKNDFEMDDILYRVEPDKTYTAYICDGLNEVVTAEDMAVNAQILADTMTVGMLAYYIDSYH